MAAAGRRALASMRTAGRRALSTLASMRGARLAYPSGAASAPLDLVIGGPPQGHALVGANGSGKSLVARAFLEEGVVVSGDVARAGKTSQVSFEAHEAPRPEAAATPLQPTDLLGLSEHELLEMLSPAESASQDHELIQLQQLLMQ